MSRATASRRSRQRFGRSARVHQCSLTFGAYGASRDKNRCCESARRRFAQKARFWRTAMRREAGDQENFFIAKNRDSEFAQQAFGGPRSAAVRSTARHACKVNDENPAAQGLLAILTAGGIDFSRTISHRCSNALPCVDECAQQVCDRHVNTSLSRTLFFSMCWCIRDAVHFDSRVHAATKPSHYIRRATWPRKLRRQRKRRAQ